MGPKKDQITRIVERCGYIPDESKHKLVNQILRGWDGKAIAHLSQCFNTFTTGFWEQWRNETLARPDGQKEWDMIEMTHDPNSITHNGFPNLLHELGLGPKLKSIKRYMKND